MYLLLNHLKQGSPSTEEDDPSTVQALEETPKHFSFEAFLCKALTVTENQSVNAP